MRNSESVILTILQGTAARDFWRGSRDGVPALVATFPFALLFGALPHMAGEVRTTRVRTGLSWAMLALTVAFWIWRNTNGYPFFRV